MLLTAEMNNQKKDFNLSSNILKSYFSVEKFKELHFRIPLLFAIIYILNAAFISAYKGYVFYSENAYLTIAIIEIATVALPTMIYQRICKTAPAFSSAKPFSPEKLIIVLLGAFAMIFGAIAITTLLSHLGIIQASHFTYTDITLPDMPSRLSSMLFASLTFALIPAFCEEILCRGVLFAEYEKYGTVFSVVLSSVFFSMMHFSLDKLPLYLFCGLVLGFLRAFTDSSLASIIAHFIYNMFTLFYEQFLGTLTEQFSEFKIVFFITLLLCFLMLFFMFGEADRIYNNYSRKNSHIEAVYKFIPKNSTKSTITQIVCSPALWLCIILYIIFSLII